MSHKANDIVTDNKIDGLRTQLFTAYDADTKEDTTEYWQEREVKAREHEEWRYEQSIPPSCGFGSDYY